MSKNNILLYLVRRDLRISDNPILHQLASSDHGFTHLLPVFVLPAQQMAVSGFIQDGSQNPYPEARSQVGGFFRCGPHRAKFIGESVWDMKESLKDLHSDLVLRVGRLSDVTEQLLQGLEEQQQQVGAVWMISEEGVEEQEDERAVSSVCKKNGVDFKAWVDEKYFVDDRDLTFKDLGELPDVFSEYRKLSEPLREKPRKSLPTPAAGMLPSLVNATVIPPQRQPFVVPDTYEQLEEALVGPVKKFLPEMPPHPENVSSAHPYTGGETSAQRRLQSLLASKVMLRYHSTRNGLLGTEFSTKLSAFLAQGSITARQVHEGLLAYEDGTDDSLKDVEGFGAGENEGTRWVRFELLWRDFMRLCTRKFKHKLFRLEGFKGGEKYADEKDVSKGKPKWKSAGNDAAPDQDPSPDRVAHFLERFKVGTMGMGLIDASQRELIHTGYTSNRARQNVAIFFAKHLSIDWRYGAEWYEMLLVDYDVCSNWANWQYVAGVGLDPKGDARIFNPVKQAFDYDKEGEYVRAWVPEVRKLEKLENVFQVWTSSAEELEQVGLTDSIMVTDPVKRIQFSVEGNPKKSRRPSARRRGKALAAQASGAPADGHNPSGLSHQRHNSQGDHHGPFGYRRGYHGGSGGMPADGPAVAPSGSHTEGHIPTGPSNQHQNSQSHYQGPSSYRGGYRGRGGSFRGRGFYSGRRGYRGNAPQQQSHPQADAGV